MRLELRAFICISVSAVLAIGFAGVGCSKKLSQTQSAPVLNGSTLGKMAVPGTQAVGSVTAPVVAEGPTCFTETFTHKPMSGHSDEESCSHHKNLLKLAHSNVNSAHVCVRVNGAPVKFERKGDEILIGSIAGPKAKITVRYCTGKLTCAAIAKEDCSVPRDEFMDAMGGGGTDDTVQWESAGANPKSLEDARLNNEVKKELADIDGVDSSEKDRAPAQISVFKEWIREENVPACEKKQAS